MTNQDSPFTKFFYPQTMFANAQVTLNTLVTLEDAFIAAYLVGVRNFSTNDLKVTAARIMGIESDHRTLARVVGGNVGRAGWRSDHAHHREPGVSESASPPNNNSYERTLLFTNIAQAAQSLLPFVDITFASKAGFNTTKSFAFMPFYPRAADGARRLPFVCGLSRGLPYSGAD